MATNAELIDERNRLGAQMCELGNAIRAMQAIQCRVEERLDWVQAELERRHGDELADIDGETA